MNECVHFWKITTAKGPTSVGRCRRCKSTKVFDNYLKYSVYNGKAAKRGWVKF